jgi:hypothetical protein
VSCASLVAPAISQLINQIAIPVHLSLLPCLLSDSYLCSLSAMDLVD